MPSTLGSLRRRLLTPALADVSFAARGFPVTQTVAVRRLEAIPQAVVCGFEWGIDAADLWELERRLELVEPEMRGFAYEGATMALTVLDAMSPGRRCRAGELLRGPAVPHTFLTYIGIGFAMAKLPRPLWRKVLPDLTGTPYYPTMSWLAVDGYAFDRAYFDTERWVHRQERLAPYPWQGDAEYFLHAADQGIGRVLWFVHGGRAEHVAAAVDRMAAERHADLWSGVGLAATFAGGCDAAGLALLRRCAGPLDAHLAQGAVFAAKARTFSGFVPPHTEVAVQALTGRTVAQATALAHDAIASESSSSTGRPVYEVWRANVRHAFDTAGHDAARR